MTTQRMDILNTLNEAWELMTYTGLRGKSNKPRTKKHDNKKQKPC